MKTSPAGLALIEQHEGFRSTVYLDSAGLPTIGYGHKLRKGESFPHPITEAEARALLAADVAIAEAAVRRLAPQANQNQFDALVDFAYNLGGGNLQVMLGHGWEKVPAQMLRWDHAGHQELAGLKARRAAEVELFKS